MINDQWAEWSKANTSALITHPIFWKVVHTPKHLQDPASIETAIKSFEAALQIADQQLQKNEYLAGSAFTMADIQLGHILYRYYDIPIKRNPPPTVTDTTKKYQADVLIKSMLQFRMMS